MLKKRVLAVAFGLAALAALTTVTPADARILVKRQPAPEATPAPAAAAEADCCTPKPVCCPEPCLVYRHCGPKLCCTCDPPTEITLKVKDPCTGCEIDVPVCLPACCKGEPEVCAGTGLFCRDVVTYDWCCGFQVKVIFRKCDVLVKTWGH